MAHKSNRVVHHQFKFCHFDHIPLREAAPEQQALPRGDGRRAFLLQGCDERDIMCCCLGLAVPSMGDTG
jgi:hypothetical protein